MKRVVSLSTAGATLAFACALGTAAQASDDDTYRATIDVRGSSQSGRFVRGFVFEDLNRDGRFQFWREPGIPGVSVSNGRDVVRTGRFGWYSLPNIQPDLHPGAMTVFVTKPAGYELPVDEDNVPQFSYVHIPDGTPPNMRGEPFRFGGLAPTGPLPRRINFPLVRGPYKERFRVAFSGDPQTYSHNELGYLRDTLVKELTETEGLEFVLFQGDIMGDDMGLMPRFKEIVRPTGLPLYLTPGNHDLDFDAATDANSFDTFKREWGPAYYSFDVGQVHFIVLDSMDYPCKADANVDGLHPGCDDDILSGATYNGVIDDIQLEWIRNDLAHVSEDKLVVVNLHIPIISFLAQNSAQGGQMDNPAELYEALGCRRAEDGSFPPDECARPLLAMNAHIHTVSNIRPGERYLGWATALDAGSLPPGRSVPNAPFPIIDIGAAAGAWWDGDFEDDGVPRSWDRSGAPKGYFLIDFDGNRYQETFKASGKDVSEQISVSLFSPTFRQWYDALTTWWASRPANEEKPPVNVNDLPDTKIVLTSELGETDLVANVWNGTRDSLVEVVIDHRPPLVMTRTQSGTGEGIVESLDPYYLRSALQVARYAFESTSGDPRAQGFERFRASSFGPASPRPGTFGTASSHVWTVPLPSDLSPGPHVAKVRTVDIYGREYFESLVFEVADERPAPYFRSELFEVTP